MLRRKHEYRIVVVSRANITNFEEIFFLAEYKIFKRNYFIRMNIRNIEGICLMGEYKKFLIWSRSA